MSLVLVHELDVAMKPLFFPLGLGCKGTFYQVSKGLVSNVVVTVLLQENACVCITPFLYICNGL